MLDTVATNEPAAAATEYQVVARKYRPQTFEELIGQEHVARGLQGAIKTNRVGHAYLFTGARGVGKTSAARIFAKALNCVNGPTPTPCNECEFCRAIAEGQDVDALEMDGASNNGVDEIRLLRQNVSVRPSRARYKIYIIDEVHMLSKSAFNALLKTLEEPPEHVKFIFCTTEADKIPITILSRCQRFDFAGVDTKNIAGRLQQIAAAENVEVEPAALELIARRAAGSMRDSQSLFEQILSLGQKKITAAEVHQLLGTANTVRLNDLLACLRNRDAAAALAALDQAVTDGVDVGQLVDQLLGHLRDCMAAAVGCPAEAMLYTSRAEFEEVQAAAQALGLESMLAMAQILDQTLSRLRYSTHGRILVEMALVRICKLEDLDQLATWITQLQTGAPLTNAPAANPARPQPAYSAPRPAATPYSDAKKKADLTPAPPAAPAEPIPAAVPAPRNVTPLTLENAPAFWQQAIGSLSSMVAEFARDAISVRAAGPQRLIVVFPRTCVVNKNMCERPETLAQFEQALSQLTGDRVKVEFQISTEAAPATAKAAEPKRPASSRQKLLEKSQHPLVKKAAELFNAPALKVEEGSDER